MTLNLDGILSAEEMAEYNATAKSDLQSKIFVLLAHLVKAAHASAIQTVASAGSAEPSVAPTTVQVAPIATKP